MNFFFFGYIQQESFPITLFLHYFLPIYYVNCGCKFPCQYLFTEAYTSFVDYVTTLRDGLCVIHYNLCIHCPASMVL